MGSGVCRAQGLEAEVGVQFYQLLIVFQYVFDNTLRNTAVDIII